MAGNDNAKQRRERLRKLRDRHMSISTSDRESRDQFEERAEGTAAKGAQGQRGEAFRRQLELTIKNTLLNEQAGATKIAGTPFTQEGVREFMSAIDSRAASMTGRGKTVVEHLQRFLRADIGADNLTFEGVNLRRLEQMMSVILERSNAGLSALRKTLSTFETGSDGPVSEDAATASGVPPASDDGNGVDLGVLGGQTKAGKMVAAITSRIERLEKRVAEMEAELAAWRRSMAPATSDAGVEKPGEHTDGTVAGRGRNANAKMSDGTSASAAVEPGEKASESGDWFESYLNPQNR